MSPASLCQILLRAELITVPESELLVAEVTSVGRTLQQAARLVNLREEELLNTLVAALTPGLRVADLTGLAHDPAALQQIAAHDAWDYLTLPVAFDPDGTLLCVTTRDTVEIAVAFLFNHTHQPFRIEVAPVGPLEQFIAERYQYEGLETEAA